MLAGDGLIAAEYNHFAPRIPSQFSALLRRKLGMSLTIGTYVQGSILEQLEPVGVHPAAGGLARAHA